MNSNTIYNVAIYMRLSRDDGDDRESESIENQRDIIKNFINEHEELKIFKEYSDDGYTGTNFNRPGFQDMIKDVESGKINCIITKDLSRFGRDHIDTGYYLERYLPLKNIRYIAIGDRVDTLKPDGLQFLTFKLSFNDYYAQDISNKVKSVKKRKIEKGEFQGGIAPYGYKKDTVQKNHLIIDEVAAKVVYSIFDMYVNKDMSSTEIAVYLNDHNVEAPSVYLKLPTFERKKSRHPSGYIWSRMQVSRVLGNQVYIGSVVGGKFKKVSHKVDKIKALNRNDYIVVENKHEAIIEARIWDKAQEKLAKHRFIKKSEHTHPLKKFVYCAECGAKATYRCRKDIRKDGSVKDYNVYVCSRKNLVQGCKGRSIRAEILEENVREKILSEMKKIVYSQDEIRNIYEKAEKVATSQIKILNDEIAKLTIQLNKKDDVINEIYDDKLNGLIVEADFKKFYMKLLKEKTEIVDLIEFYKKQRIIIENSDKKDNYFKMINLATKVLNLENFTEELYEELIEKIEIDKERKIKLTLKFGQVDISNNDMLLEVAKC